MRELNAQKELKTQAKKLKKEIREKRGVEVVQADLELLLEAHIGLRAYECLQGTRLYNEQSTVYCNALEMLQRKGERGAYLPLVDLYLQELKPCIRRGHAEIERAILKILKTQNIEHPALQHVYAYVGYRIGEPPGEAYRWTSLATGPTLDLLRKQVGEAYTEQEKKEKFFANLAVYHRLCEYKDRRQI